MTPPRLLLVDDNPLDVLLLSEQLGDDYAVTSAGTLAGGLEAIVAHRPDCAVVDLTLPDARGAEVIAALHAAAPEVPLIAHSGLAAAQVGDDVIEAGARAYVVKGPSVQELLAVLRSVVV